jgi:hypothetical protein
MQIISNTSYPTGFHRQIDDFDLCDAMTMMMMIA